MPVTDQPSGDWESNLILGAPCTGPLLLAKGCCCPCWGLGALAASRKFFTEKFIIVNFLLSQMFNKYNIYRI